jgi:hypothetical protein
MDDDESKIDETVLDRVHALARIAADEAGVSVDEVSMGLTFKRGEAHWTARVRGAKRGIRAHGPCVALRRLAAFAGAP